MIRLLKTLAFFLPTLSLAAPSGGQWWTFRTEHFHVHHSKAQEPFARSFAESLEKYLDALEKDLAWQLPAPVDIVINDSSDDANGFALSFPANRIEVFAVPYNAEGSLAEYGNWIDELAAHELTHLIANDTIDGWYRTFRSIFGSWVKPNGLQAPWLIEGLAVYQETKLTPAGRGRSALLESLLRTELQQGRQDLLRLDRFNEGLAWWPGGSAAYLLGYTLQASWNKEKEQSGAGAFSRANASRFPYMPNTNAEALFGKDLYALWAATLEKLQNRYPAPQTLKAPCVLSSGGRFSGSPQVHVESGTIYFVWEHPKEGLGLGKRNFFRPCAEEAEFFKPLPRIANNKISLAPSGNTLLFLETETSADHSFSRLFLLDLNTGTKSLLSEKERVIEAFFQDEENILYLVNRGDGTQALRERNKNTAPTSQGKEIASAPLFYRWSDLARGQKPKSIFLSEHNNQGQERIVEISLDRGEKSFVLPKRKGAYSERGASALADGSLLYAANYSEGGNGLAEFSLYRFDPKKQKETLVARSPNGYLKNPSLFQEQVLAMEYSHQGFRLVSLPLQGNADPSPASTKEKTKDLHEFLSAEKPTEPVKPVRSVDFSASVPYTASSSPATSLWPQYWVPLGQAVVDGWLLGAATSGNDPLDHHNYSASLLYDTRAKFPHFRVSYLNRENPVLFRFDASQSNNYFQGSKESNKRSIYAAEAFLPKGLWVFSFGSAFEEKNLFSRKTQSFFLFQSMQYTNFWQLPASLETNRGIAANLYIAEYPSNRFENAFIDIRPSVQAKIPALKPEHALSLKVNAGISTNRLLVSNYYQGGMPSSLSDSSYNVRGYPVDVMLGQRIATANLSYSLPLGAPHAGWKTNPLFWKDYGLRFHFDAGTANFLARYRKDFFLGYETQAWMKKVLLGTGLDFVTNGKIFHYLPLRLALGLHKGLNARYGGEWTFYTGLEVGALPGLSNREKH